MTKPNTLVEFRLEEAAGATKVTLLKSGFNSLPAELMEECFKQNTGGWEYMMGQLTNLFSEK